MCLPLGVVPVGSFPGLHHWTRRMRAETSICLHDCLGFIALGELLLSRALPLKRTIFASELGARSDLASLRRRQVAIDDANAAFCFDQSHLSIRCWKAVAPSETITQPQIMTVSITQDRSLRQDFFFTVTSAVSRCRMRSYAMLRDSSPGSKKENLDKRELS